MQRGLFKAETNIYYTAWDLNCRSVVPHTPSRNHLEKQIKRHARRTIKKELKGGLYA